MLTDPTARPDTCDLTSVLVRVAESLRPVATARGVQLSLELGSGDLAVPGVERYVHDAVLDVAGQAVSTCASGTVVVLDLHRTDHGVALDIVDTGAGTSAHRADTRSMALAVESYGGQVNVAAVEGVGTSVRIWWPVAVAAAPVRRHLTAV